MAEFEMTDLNTKLTFGLLYVLLLVNVTPGGLVEIQDSPQTGANLGPQHLVTACQYSRHMGFTTQRAIDRWGFLLGLLPNRIITKLIRVPLFTTESPRSYFGHATLVPLWSRIRAFKQATHQL